MRHPQTKLKVSIIIQLKEQIWLPGAPAIKFITISSLLLQSYALAYLKGGDIKSGIIRELITPQLNPVTSVYFVSTNIKENVLTTNSRHSYDQ
jgi:hypothetical protein